MSKIRGKKTYQGLKELIESNGKRFCKKFFWGLLSSHRNIDKIYKDLASKNSFNI